MVRRLAPVPASPAPPQSFGSERWSAFHRVGRDGGGSRRAEVPRLLDDDEVHRHQQERLAPTSAPPSAPTLPPPPAADCAPPALLDKPHNFSNITSDEEVHFLCPRLPGPGNWSGKSITNLMRFESDIDKFHLTASPKSDRYLSNTSPVTECELPIKKRKPFVADSNTVIGQTVFKSGENNSRTNQIFLSGYFCELTASSKQCYKCQQMKNLEALPGPTGKFCSWNSLIVQQWLLKELKAKYPELSLNVICCLLQKLEGRNGINLSTFTKKELRKSLDNIQGHQAVYDLICQKLAAESLCTISESGATLESDSHDSHQIPVSQQTRMNITKPRRRRDKCVGQLWEFIYNLLENRETNPSVVTWENKDEKLFRIVNTEEIARRWGDHKGNKNMTYANMSRTMRYYREGNGAFVRNDRKRVYGFGPKADFKRLEAKLAKRKSNIHDCVI
ncbi:ETS-related transcription factor Elf-5 [Frankliniella fusca]|uniref:ETS-related transcription factor Elf-5 n=1 Tax=Frankliniella fusca TaxID=407009 RepID=A0AAE1HJS9_9NEOP|nr:ETS-related transcription factor Elf-5 [Frankliniella fusca]